MLFITKPCCAIIRSVAVSLIVNRGMEMNSTNEIVTGDKFAKFCGIELIEVGNGTAKTRLKIEPYHLNGVGMVHGGVLFTLADYTFSAAANSHGRLAVSISASISYINAGKSGTLTATAKELAVNSKVGTYAVEIKDDTGQTLAAFQGLAYKKYQK
jgi:acyl-CoA thioesterase